MALASMFPPAAEEPKVEAIPEAPAEEVALEASAPAASLSVDDYLEVVNDWIVASLDTAPPVSQLHFSLHLFQQMEDLRERLCGLTS